MYQILSKIIITSLLLAWIFNCSMAAPVVQSKSSTVNQSKPTVPVNPPDSATPLQPVNINTADVIALTSLKGLGEKRAQAIVDYRQQHGPFAAIAGLTKVKGIGQKRLAQLLANNPGRLVLHRVK